MTTKIYCDKCKAEIIDADLVYKINASKNKEGILSTFSNKPILQRFICYECYGKLKKFMEEK